MKADRLSPKVQKVVFEEAFVSTLWLFWAAKLFSVGVLLYRLWLGRGALESPGFGDPAAAQEALNCEGAAASVPFVCVQLPLFNERGQVAGLLESVAGLRWPAQRILVQVLDDSTDPICRQEVDTAVQVLQALRPELSLVVLRRSHRSGYKAGALNAGVTACPQAEIFALFDCDFRPTSDFLEKMVPEFQREPLVAAVQAPWSFRNSKENVLTRLQTVLLGVHFRQEHRGRQSRRWVLNFNGTAGLWRREALEQLGGWSSETVTEDLLLSYRAELAGWRIRYTEVVHCSSELPAALASYLVQQRRWAKGHGQVLRILGSRVLRKKGWGFAKKFDALFHLHSYGISVLLAGLLIVLPWWVAERSVWVSATAGLSAQRLADGGLWVANVGLAVLFFSRPALYGFALNGLADGIPKASVKSRLLSAGTLLLFLPYLSLLVLPRFLTGLLASKRRASESVFERTPKAFSSGQERFAVSKSDRAVLFSLSGYFLFISGLCVLGELWFLAATFGVQAFAGPRLLAEGLKTERGSEVSSPALPAQVLADGEGP